jgi:predicted ester cyclase
MKTIKYLSGIIAVLVLLLMNSCQDKQAKEELAKFKQAESIKTTNIELAKKFYRYLDELNFDTLRAICDPSLKIFYESGDPVSLNDMEPFIKSFYGSFPDYKHEIEDIYANDDKVIVRLAYSGTHTKGYMDIKPTGLKFKYKGIQIFQFTNKKAINFWAIEDELGMMTQLGMELKPKK